MKYLICIIIGMAIVVSGYFAFQNYKLNQEKTPDTKVEFIEENKQITNPKIIIDELNKVGELVVYQGEIEYIDTLVEDNWYGGKSVKLNLKYNFGISYNLSDVKISQIIKQNIILDLNSNLLKLKYLELSKNSIVEGDNWGISSEFNPSKMNLIQKNAYEKTWSDVESKRKYFDEAYLSLKDNISSLISKLGYDNIVYNN